MADLLYTWTDFIDGSRKSVGAVRSRIDKSTCSCIQFIRFSLCVSLITVSLNGINAVMFYRDIPKVGLTYIATMRFKLVNAFLPHIYICIYI